MQHTAKPSVLVVDDTLDNLTGQRNLKAPIGCGWPPTAQSAEAAGCRRPTSFCSMWSCR